MNSRALFLALVLCLVLLAGIALMTDQAAAQTAKGDKSIAERTGLAEAKLDKDRLPGTKEISITIGSIIAMVVAIKYL